MAINQLAEGNPHHLFDIARRIHMAGNAEEFRAHIVRITKRGEPTRTTAQNRARHGNRLDIVNSRRIAIKAHISRKRRLQARLAFFAL